MKVAAIRTSTSGSLHVTLRSAADRMRRISLAAHYGRAFTRWTAGFHTPTLARSLGVSHARTGKIVPDVTVESPLSLGGRNTLGNATRCGRDTRTASGLCQLWSKESGNCAGNDSSNQELIHDSPPIRRPKGPAAKDDTLRGRRRMGSVIATPKGLRPSTYINAYRSCCTLEEIRFGGKECCT
jgi:hypothetical protein